MTKDIPYWQHDQIITDRIAGAVYHLTSKGNAQQAIFLDEKDFADFLGVLCLVVKIYHFIFPFLDYLYL